MIPAREPRPLQRVGVELGVRLGRVGRASKQPAPELRNVEHGPWSNEQRGAIGGSRRARMDSRDRRAKRRGDQPPAIGAMIWYSSTFGSKGAVSMTCLPSTFFEMTHPF